MEREMANPILPSCHGPPRDGSQVRGPEGSQKASERGRKLGHELTRLWWGEGLVGVSTREEVGKQALEFPC